MGIYWLASYPKSGNTWLRAFLTNYRSGAALPADINSLEGRWTSADRETFENYTGVDSADLTDAQIDWYRPQVYQRMTEESSIPLFFKIHDAYSRNSQGDPLFPESATSGVIYLVRNPLDVAVSYAHHQAKPVDEVIDAMADPAAGINVSSQLPQRLTTWSRHIQSWVDESDLRIFIGRYEDLIREPARGFARIVRFIGLPFEEQRLQRAIEFSSFDVLQAQESARGFREKQPAAKCFFREGRVGGWRTELNEYQVRRLVSDHRCMMLRFGYLSPVNELLV